MVNPSAPADRWFSRKVAIFLGCTLVFLGWAVVWRIGSGVGLSGGIPPVLQTMPEPITGSVLLLNDGVTIVYSDPDGICRDSQLSATEDSTRVALSLTETDVEPLFCSHHSLPSEPIATARLVRPLGSRVLVDARTDRPVPYFDQHRELYLDSPTLPRSWTQITDPPYADASTEVPFFGGPGSAVLVETYMAPRSTTEGDSKFLHLQVVQVVGGGWHPPTGTVTSPVMVRGRSGLAAAGIIVWTESGMTVAVIGYGPEDPAAWSMTDNTDPLPTAQLIDIANHLYRGAT